MRVRAQGPSLHMGPASQSWGGSAHKKSTSLRARRAASPQQSGDGVWVDTRESRGADVLEEAKAVVGGHGDKVESRRGEVNGKHKRPTWTGNKE